MNWNDLYRILHEYYGDIQWWEPENKLEVVIGSILGQNTTWTSVEKAIANLKEAKLFTLKKLANAPAEVVEQLIRPSGYYHLKTIRLQNLLKHILEKYKTLDKMFLVPLEELREELLSLNGVGAETADSILLYAGALPSFVVDAYTKRIVSRHGWDRDFRPKNKSSRAQYDAIWNSFMEQLEPSAATMAQLHAFIIETAKQFCHKSNPQCEGCPLFRFERVENF